MINPFVRETGTHQTPSKTWSYTFPATEKADITQQNMNIIFKYMYKYAHKIQVGLQMNFCF